MLTVDQITKTYGEKVLFERISFTISEKQRIGLIGVNGTGKSSLLRIIAGLDGADEGRVIHAHDYRVEYLAQSPDFTENITVLDYVFRGEAPIMQAIREYETMLFELQRDPACEQSQSRLFASQQRMDALHAWDASTQAKSILTKLGITEFDKPVALLSGGQRKRVALAAALIQSADLLILDEPTNHIDHSTVEWLEDYLSKYKGALLLVTHDRYFLDRVTNRIFELNRGKLHAYDGNYEVYLEKKADREEMEAAAEDKRQNLLRRELAWLRRGAKARTTKQKARVDRAVELQEQTPDAPEEAVDFSVSASRLGKKVLEIEQLSKKFEDRPLIQNFSYIVLPRDRIGMIGPNGSGKSTLLNMLAGRFEPDSGTIDVGQTVKLAYYTQENEEMNGNLRVIEYIKEGAEMIRAADGTMISASQMLERFLFPASQQWTRISKLSGGERRRLYLLRTLMGEPNVLLLDEPTNDMDIQTLTILEDYLDQFPGVVITVSHDRYFLDRVADRLFIFEGEGIIRTFEGNYSEFMEQAAINEVNNVKDKQAQANSGPAATPRTKDRPRKLSFKEQKEWDEIEEQISSLELEGARLKEEIAGAGSDFTKVQTLYEQEQKLAAELERTVERWAELSQLVEEIAQNSRT